MTHNKKNNNFNDSLLTGVLGVALALIVSISNTESAPATLMPAEDNKSEKQIVVKEEEPLSEYDKSQIRCLAENAYFEAGNQSIKGKIAVSNVVMNRVNDKRFPKTPCAVIYQRTKQTCQFSWVCQGKIRIRSESQFADSHKVAKDVYLGKVGDVTNGAKFFHAVYINPRWNRRWVATIGDHIFYK
jgi:spore germination cell wall hydrolase CwlJ-like protein